VTALLEVHELAKAYGGVHAVRGVSLSVASGEIVAFIGPNGAGKSTCFNMLNGQIRPDAGTIRLDGRDIAGWPPREVWRLGVGRTFQITATFASMSVIENVQSFCRTRDVSAASGALRPAPNASARRSCCRSSACPRRPAGRRPSLPMATSSGSNSLWRSPTSRSFS
jgi:ABC-type branched-subunit amino acid transport system ATPase component